MDIHNVQQGTEAWHQLRHAYYTASEAAAMMGDSSYQTREKLMLAKMTGQREEITPQKQALFDRGHATEAAARPLAEEILMDELFPTTGTRTVSGLPLLASFDGMNMMGSVLFEHKLYSKKVVAMIEAKQLEASHYWQLEHQLLVSGADKVLFVCSDGTREHFHGHWYSSDPKRRAQLIQGWKEFHEELQALKAANNQPEPEPEVVVRDEDEDFQNAEVDYLQALEALSIAKAALDNAKGKLLEATNGQKTKGAFVQVYPVSKKGAVSWQKAFKAFAPGIPDAELEPYRGKPSTTWTVKQHDKV